jgi:ABC-2 type transport system permease protein
VNKTFVIATREYFATVRTKGFIFGIILMPILMAGGAVLQSLTQRIVDLDTHKVAVLDRTPGGTLALALKDAPQRGAADPPVKTQSTPRAKFEFEIVPLPADLDSARLAMSQRVRDGELFATVEIGPKVLDAAASSDRGTGASPGTSTATAPSDTGEAPVPQESEEASQADAAKPDPDTLIYYSSNRPTFVELRDFVEQAIESHVVAARLGQSRESIRAVTDLLGTLVVPRGLASRDEAGQITFEPRRNELVLTALPVVMVMLMLMVVLVGASPLTTNIIEEKQLRIGEVLLGSVSPFQLMMGKLLGGVATSLTLGAIYVAGAIFIAKQLGVLHLLTPGIIVWFVIFVVVAGLMYGAMFVVAGAAATNIKEAQALVTPMMLIVVLPLFLVGPILSSPHGTVARIGTFFPFSAPMVAMMRIAVPPALPWWHLALAALSSTIAMLILVWIAGRVFRAGFLLVGRPASLKELIAWIVRG